MAQPIEPIEEQVDPKLNRSRSKSTPSSTGLGVQKTFSFFQNGCSIGQGWALTDRPLPQLVEVRSRGGRDLTVTCQTLNANG